MQAAGVLVDDFQIASHDGSRRYLDRQNPRVEITLTPFREKDMNETIAAIRRSNSLHDLERIYRSGNSSVREMAEALKRIHDAKLYTLTASSWESYCTSLGTSVERADSIITYASRAA
jgi:hypothetical protein